MSEVKTNFKDFNGLMESFKNEPTVERNYNLVLAYLKKSYDLGTQIGFCEGHEVGLSRGLREKCPDD